VIVDTDLPTLSEAIHGSGLATDVSVDALRVDVLASNGSVTEFREFVAPSKADWPISFAVPSADAPVLLRLRAYRSSLGTPTLEDDVTTIEPAIVTTVDRFVLLPRPTSGISAARITLHGDCINRPVSFLGGLSHCLDADHLTTPLLDGDMEVSSDTSTRASVTGTWTHGREEPCSGSAPVGTVCIPGGMTLLGAAAINGVLGATLPYRLAYVRPFFVDQTEFTVKRYRELLNAHKVAYLPTSVVASGKTYCSFVSATTASADPYPLNCITKAAAIAACRAEGGKLVTEAQFERAAGGREHRPFPWGDTPASCCTADLSRTAAGTAAECKGSPLDHAGSHTSSSACAAGGPADESRDGVLDLGGSLREIVLDGYHEYSEPCWSWAGFATDPLCSIAGDGAATKGAAWDDALASPSIARHLAAMPPFDDMGFRCAYDGTTP
jgi:formylglycine-generating enzyme required for sulfatase activity